MQLLALLGHHHLSLYPLLYMLMVYRFMGDVTSMLGAAFFIVGFWLFYECEGRLRVWGSAVAFTLAILTKYMAAAPIAITVAYVCFVRDSLIVKSSKGRLLLNYKLIKGALPAAFVVGGFFLVSFLILNLHFLA